MSEPRYMGKKPYPDGVCGSCRWYAFWTTDADGECNAPLFSKRTGFMSRGIQRRADKSCSVTPVEWERRTP